MVTADGGRARYYTVFYVYGTGMIGMMVLLTVSPYIAVRILNIEELEEL